MNNKEWFSQVNLLLIRFKPNNKIGAVKNSPLSPMSFSLEN